MTRVDHEPSVFLAGVGYQAGCSCGWRGVIRASDRAIRRAKQECDDHLAVAASKHDGQEPSDG